MAVLTRYDMQSKRSRIGSGKAFKRTGRIWQMTPSARGQVVRRVCECLLRTYGLPRLGNPGDPTDDLVYIIISNKTSPSTATAIYQDAKERFCTWDKVLEAPLDDLYSVIKPAGLAAVKSRQIRDTLWRIREEVGSYDLNPLRERSAREIEEYLTSLPGISDKVAKCVMMYTMGAQVLPVDTHVHRICKRLGWADRKRADQSHAELEALVPPTRRYAFHVDCIAHGRSVCRPVSPACADCCISRYCNHYQSVNDCG